MGEAIVVGGFTKAKCEIRKCSCAHASQDKMYGKGMRVLNPGKSHYHCTVCGKQHQI